MTNVCLICLSLTALNLRECTLAAVFCTIGQIQMILQGSSEFSFISGACFSTEDSYILVLHVM